MTVWLNPTGGNGWYWSVQDSSPGTQVWQGLTGQFVVLANADYVAFLAAGNAATPIDTFADLMTNVVNYYNSSVPRPGYQAASGAIDTAIANPPPLVYDFTAGVGASVVLPVMDVFGSLPLGQQILIHNNGVNTFNIKYQDDATTAFSNVRTGEYVQIVLQDNTTQNGTIFGRRFPTLPQSVLYGGIGTTSLSAHGVALGEGSSPFGVAVATTASYPLVANGSTSDPSFQALSLASTFVTSVLGVVNGGSATSTLTANAVLLGGTTNTATLQFANATTAGYPLVANGSASAPSFQALGLASTFVSGVLGVPNGGIGTGTLSGLALGNGTSAFSAVSYVAQTVFTTTDQSGAGLTFSSMFLQYSQVANNVSFFGRINFPVTANTAANLILTPTFVPNQQYAILPGAAISNVGPIDIVSIANTTTAAFFNSSTAAQYTNAQLSGQQIRFMLIYPVS